jgi:membrane-associated phospholipid phosphatase
MSTKSPTSKLCAPTSPPERTDMAKWLELDARLSARLRVLEKPGLLRSLAIFFGHSGDSWFWLAALLLLALFGGAAWRPWAYAFILAILITAGVVLLIKFSVRRQRPEGEWGQMYRRTDPHSFPSGHAARAAMLAVLAVGLGPAWLAAILLIWAPLVGLARVATGLHYLSDVLAGWLLGVVMGLVMIQASNSLFVI